MKDVGGQAVMDGVMMKHRDHYSVAVRTDKGIKVLNEKYTSISERYGFLKWPFLRGVVQLFEMMIIGLKSLSWSANQNVEEEEELTKKEIVFTIVSAVFLSLGLFVALPFFLTRLVSSDQGILFNLIDGFFRLLVFLLYVLAISLFKDVRTLFEYHGAEHKSIFCYEDGKALTVKNAKKYSTRHPRCGTSFLMIVVMVSIVVFSFVTDPRWYVKLGLRFVLIPVVAGISYEALKLSAKHKNNFVVRLLILPGLVVQHITTKEPDDKQLAVGLRALKEVLKARQ